MSETTLGFLSTLSYRADAELLVCWLPLSGIYWDDEIPDIRQLMSLPKDDRNQIFQLYGIRRRLWKGEFLLEAEQQFWDATYSQVPSWVFFRRQQISDHDQHAQEKAEREAAAIFDELVVGADRLSIHEKDGVQEFSATFDFEEETNPYPKETHVVGASI